MLAIVKLALSRPYTFVVAALLIFLLGTLAALRMPVDIFPSINIPIIGVAFQYQGLPPDQMAGRVITPFQRALTTTVNDIEHIEANSYTTFGVVKIYFHPTANIATANAQVTAIAQTLLKQLPARRDPSPHPQLQRLDGTDHPACAVGQGPDRTEPRGLGHQFRAHATGHRARRRNSPIPLAARRRRSCTTSIPGPCSRLG